VAAEDKEASKYLRITHRHRVFNGMRHMLIKDLPIYRWLWEGLTRKVARDTVLTHNLEINVKKPRKKHPAKASYVLCYPIYRISYFPLTDFWFCEFV